MYDVFVSYATEDRDDAAQPIAEKLLDFGLSVWFDRLSLQLGDSLRQTIERGIADSRYGVVIISPHFFAKNWPQNELNGLFGRESTGGKVVLPVWHNIDYETVRAHAPILADRFAARTEDGLDRAVEQILEVVAPELARDVRNARKLRESVLNVQRRVAEFNFQRHEIQPSSMSIPDGRQFASAYHDWAAESIRIYMRDLSSEVQRAIALLKKNGVRNAELEMFAESPTNALGIDQLQVLLAQAAHELQPPHFGSGQRQGDAQSK